MRLTFFEYLTLLNAIGLIAYMFLDVIQWHAQIKINKEKQ